MPKTSIDMTGEVYGRLTVLEYGGIDAHRHTLWICQCECGRRTVVTRESLLKGSTRSCGCIRRKKEFKPRGMDRIGQKVNGLTIIGRGSDDDVGYHFTYICLCACGQKCEIRSDSIHKKFDCGCKIYRKQQLEKLESTGGEPLE